MIALVLCILLVIIAFNINKLIPYARHYKNKVIEIYEDYKDTKNTKNTYTIPEDDNIYYTSEQANPKHRDLLFPALQRIKSKNPLKSEIRLNIKNIRRLLEAYFVNERHYTDTELMYGRYELSVYGMKIRNVNEHKP